MKLKTVFLSILCMVVVLSKVSADFVVIVDKPTTVGINFGYKNGSKLIPGPLCGTWPLYNFEQVNNKPITLIFSIDKASSDEKVVVNFTIKTKGITGNDLNHTSQFNINIFDWSHGRLSEEKRKLGDFKHLLDHDIYPSPLLKNGLVSTKKISITKYVIGYRDGEEVCLVARSADDWQTLRENHELPKYVTWGRDVNDIIKYVK